MFYSGSQDSDYLIIHIVSGKYDLNIDTEDMSLHSEVVVQNVPAKIYLKNDDGQISIIFTKNDLTIRIRGNLTEAEAKKIAENIKFM